MNTLDQWEAEAKAVLNSQEVYGTWAQARSDAQKKLALIDLVRKKDEILKYAAAHFNDLDVYEAQVEGIERVKEALVLTEDLR